jgi:hypothetical protein
MDRSIQLAGKEPLHAGCRDGIWRSGPSDNRRRLAPCFQWVLGASDQLLINSLLVNSFHEAFRDTIFRYRSTFFRNVAFWMNNSSAI